MGRGNKMMVQPMRSPSCKVPRGGGEQAGNEAGGQACSLGAAQGEDQSHAGHDRLPLTPSKKDDDSTKYSRARLYRHPPAKRKLLLEAGCQCNRSNSNSEPKHTVLDTAFWLQLMVTDDGPGLVTDANSGSSGWGRSSKSMTVLITNFDNFLPIKFVV